MCPEEQLAALRKIRLDQLLVERGLAETRTKAQSLVLAGLIYSGTRKLEKPGTQVKLDIALELKGKVHPWVSRGGLKLDHGLKYFDLSVAGMTALDIGASTGGFTEVLLNYGVAKVFAVDVGYGQLAWKLRQDDRVVVMERTNARHLTNEKIPEPLNFLVCDASFIGLRTVLKPAMDLLEPRGQLIALIKPQFEVGKKYVSKKGVVRDPALQDMACSLIEKWISGLPSWSVLGVTESPIKGPQGNTEFLLAAQKK